jgi:hypothetical protein
MQDRAFMSWSIFSTSRSSHVWTLFVRTSRFFPLFNKIRAANICHLEIAQIFIPSALLNNYDFCYYYYPKEAWAVRIEFFRSLQFTFYILLFHLVPFNLSIGRAFNNYSPHHKCRRNVKYAIGLLTPDLWYQSAIPLFHIRKLKNCCCNTVSQ